MDKKKINSLLNSLPFQGKEATKKPLSYPEDTPSDKFSSPCQEKEATKKYGFTLVELIVVITIIAILGTIAFMTLQGYSKDARDSVRITDIKSAETGLELFQLDAGKYPEPDEMVSYTGGTSEIKQGILGEGVVRNIRLDKILEDPLTNKNYVYSIFGKGLYYQIAADSEDTETSSIQSTYAAEPVTSIVRGNYKFDPTLPSLILVPSSVTSSGIFDPNVCFVVDGGKNTLNNCVEKKNEMSLKDFDDALVGYWDMESLSDDGKLKDMSGYGSNGVCYNNNTNNAICGSDLLGPIFKSGSVEFNGIYPGSHIRVNNSIITELNNITITSLINIKKDGINDIIGKYRSTSNSGYQFRVIDNNLYSMIGVDDETRTFSGGYIENEKNYSVTMIYDGENIKLFINGKKFVKNFGSYKNIKPETRNLYISDMWFSHPLGGIIDDVKIYNRVLSDKEVLQQSRIAGF